MSAHGRPERFTLRQLLRARSTHIGLVLLGFGIRTAASRAELEARCKAADEPTRLCWIAAGRGTGQ